MAKYLTAPAVALVAIILTLPASADDDPWTVENAPEDGYVTIVTFFGEMLPGLRAIAPDFEEKTGLELRPQAMPYSVYRMWLRTQFLGKRPPEVLILEADVPNPYGQSGLLINFDDFIDDPNPLAADPRRPWGDYFRNPLIMQSRDVAGDLWYLPFTQFAVGFFYNKDVYHELDLEPPETWNDMVEGFSRIKTEHDLPAIAVAIKPNDAQSQWMAMLLYENLSRHLIDEVNIDHQEGWEFDPLDRENTLNERISLTERIIAFEKGLTDPARAPEFAKTFRLLKEFSKTWRPDFISLDGQEAYNLFSTGQTANTMNGTWYFQTLLSDQALMEEIDPEQSFQYDTFSFPEIDAELTEIPLAGGINQNAGMRGNLIVPKQLLEPWREEAGMLLVRYLTLPEVSERMFEASLSWDISALKEVPPRAEAEPLLPETKFAFLPVAYVDGYDNQSNQEFWPLMQLYLGEDISLEEFLGRLSQVHWEAIVRLTEIHPDQVDQDLIQEELGSSFP